MKTNEIYYGDCLELLSDTPNNSIDLVVTSPPYADTLSYGNKVKVFHPDNYVDWFLPIINEIYRVMKPTASFILNINDKCEDGLRSTYIYELIYRISKETDTKFYDRYIWCKKSGLPSGSDKRLTNRTEYIFHFVKDVNVFKNYPDRIRIPYSDASRERYKAEVRHHKFTDDTGHCNKGSAKKLTMHPLGRIPDNVFRFPTSGTKKESSEHPAAFHPNLPKFFIDWLTDEDDIVLDPFIGCGTTAVACLMTDRQYIGMELNTEYKPIIDKRISKYDGYNLFKKFI